MFDDIFDFYQEFDGLKYNTYRDVTLKKEIATFAERTQFDAAIYDFEDKTLSFFVNIDDEEPVASFKVHQQLTLTQVPVKESTSNDA